MWLGMIHWPRSKPFYDLMDDLMDDFADDVGGRRMRKMCLAILLCAFLVVCGFALAASSVPERNQESEQRIASMEVNQSAGNMTGEDYIIALIYAYFNDKVESYITQKEGDSFEQLQEEASSKYGEYRSIYYGSQFANKLGQMSTASMECDGGGYDCSTKHPVIPRQGFIDLFVYEVFHNDSELNDAYPHTGSSVGISEKINEARSAYNARIKEEAEREAARKEKEANRLKKQEENAARQAALDAHYKALFDNTTNELQKLVNDSENTTNSTLKEDKLLDALFLTSNASSKSVSPYRNILAIYSGDILVKMGTLNNNRTNAVNIINSLERYEYATTNFTYSNESEDYQKVIYKDFIDNWGRIVQMKTGIAEDRLKEELHAMLTDSRDAPNVKLLLSGHINKKYEVTVFNCTEPMIIKAFEASDYPYADQPGYWVQVNISAYNNPESSNIDEYVVQNIPICIDIFSSLFSDERISMVYIQLNETYYDRFGHTEERPVMIASLNNVTATEIGDWPAFKKYIGKDMERFKQVVEVSY